MVQSPVSFVEGQYARPVDVGRTIGTSSLNDGGGVTTVIKIFTDGSGNLIIAFPQ